MWRSGGTGRACRPRGRTTQAARTTIGSGSLPSSGGRHRSGPGSRRGCGGRAGCCFGADGVGATAARDPRSCAPGLPAETCGSPENPGAGTGGNGSGDAVATGFAVRLVASIVSRWRAPFATGKPACRLRGPVAATVGCGPTAGGRATRGGAVHWATDPLRALGRRRAAAARRACYDASLLRTRWRHR